MWILLTTLASLALGADPEGEPEGIDCAVHDNAEGCKVAQTQLAEIDEKLADLDCAKGRKKKREACAVDKAKLEEQRTQLVEIWRAPESEEEEEVLTRGLEFGDDTEAEDDGMEIEISDE